MFLDFSTFRGVLEFQRWPPLKKHKMEILIMFRKCTPKLLKRFKCEFKNENNGRKKS
jgi:hypothetical protein